MAKRIGAIAVAGGFLGFVVYLGIRAAADPALVIWFGLAAAILAPAAFQLLAIALMPIDSHLVRRLSSMPQIAELIAQAESEQERVRLLEEERRRLGEIIRLEARREALAERHSRLLEDAAEMLADLDAVETEQSTLMDETNDSAALPEIDALRQRLAARRRGDVVFSIRGRDYVIDPDAFNVSGPLFLFLPAQTTRLVLQTLASLSNRRR